MNIFRSIVLLFSLLCALNGLCLDKQVQAEIGRHLSTGNYDSAQIYIKSELKKPQDYKSEIVLNDQLVSVLIYMSKYKEALEVAFAAIDKIEGNEEKAKFHFLIGCIFYAVEDDEKSIEYFNKSLAKKDPSLNAKALLISSEIYVKLEQIDKATQALRKANEISENTALHPSLKDQIALQYNFQLGNYEICKSISEATLKDTSAYMITKCNALSVIGDCLEKQDSLSKSAKYYEQALELCIEMEDPDLIKTTSWKLIGVYENLGEQNRANSIHKIYNDAINDSTFFARSKFRELYALEQERKAKKTDQKVSTSSNWIWIIAALGLLGFSLLIIFLFFRKKEELEVKKEVVPAKKIQINSDELDKIKRAVDGFVSSESYLESGITLKSFCDQHKIRSERYLSQFINEHYEKSFSSFLNDLRIEYAYHRIKTDQRFRNYKTTEIAKTCGFGSRKTFERVFLAKYKQSPYDFILSVNS